jgi:hypothetical protein
MSTGRQAILDAFDQLFEAAMGRLDVTCTQEEKDEARAKFAQRMGSALDAVDAVPNLELPRAVVDDMRQSIERLTPAEVAGLVASLPLAQRTQAMLRAIAIDQARERLLEHLTAQADSEYGGH